MLARSAVFSYGVAGSPVVLTTRIGGAPSAASEGSGATGGSGQYAEVKIIFEPQERNAGVLISIMVLLVIPLITAHFASKLIVDHDAFRHEEQEELKHNLRRVKVLLEALAEREGVTLPDTAGPPAAPSDR